MNSEELELSLRSEFEAHVKAVLADVQQQVADFQVKIDAEFDKHRSLMDEAFKDFVSRLAGEQTLDQPFRQSLVEHLRLARDDGARVAASAMAEAEAMGADSARTASFSLTRDAVKEISSQTSQSAILRSLVDYAEQFCPRGVFFIVRNEHFVGWQALGREVTVDDTAVRELSFPLSGATALADSVRDLATIERPSGEGDSVYLDALRFGRPAMTYSIPLVARGRGVAALYVDGGKANAAVNIEALEMLVRVAGLTVELLASNQAARPQSAEAEEHTAKPAPVEHSAVHARVAPAPDADTQDDHGHVEPAQVESAPVEPSPVEYTPVEPEPVEEAEPEQYQLETSQTWQAPDTTPQVGPVSGYDPAPVYEPETEAPSYEPEVPAYEVETFSPEASETIEVQEIEVEPQVAQPEQAETVETARDFAFRHAEEHSDEDHHEDTAEPAPQVESNGHAGSNGHIETTSVATNNVTTTVQHTIEPRQYGGTRRLDLPIEVAEDERGTHTKARRFARLLVSEIKLYNEEKVREGREAGDLYDRLREAIDRSREMYDKRVEPPVSSRFDYFHYELVNDLAEGDAGRLGSHYPGAAV